MAEVASAPDGEVNYRQAGRAAQAGRLHLSRTAGQRLTAAPRPPTTATIPSRYETTLLADTRAREGFGSQASRFSLDSVSDAPGPGAYDAGGSTVLRSAPSIGKRGYGVGFASRSRRTAPAAAGARASPGPGNYDSHRYKATGSDARAVSRPFQPAKGGRALRPDGADSRPLPGPGSYDPTPPLGEAAAAAAPGRGAHGPGRAQQQSHVFASTNPRFPPPNSTLAAATGAALLSGRDAPGPGAYDPRPAHGASGRDGFHRGPSAPFASGVARTLSEPNSAAPKLPREITLGVSSAPPPPNGGAVGVGAGGGVPPALAAAVTPGPGTYAPQVVTDAYAKNAAAGPSHVFRFGNTDRFGHPVQRHSRVMLQGTPGPGAYDTRNAPTASGHKTLRGVDEEAAISSSVFMSGVSRTAAGPDAGRAPGPAYYAPSHGAVLGRKTFHFNASKKWVSL